MAEPVLERELLEQGFTRSSFLSPTEVDRLKSLHDSLHPTPGSGFDTDFAYVAPAHKALVDRGIRAVVEPLAHRIFGDVKLFNVTFVSKWPGTDSSLPVHQDWSYVDERTDRACTLWVPLDPTSPGLDNGPLGVLPRSHRLPAYRRGANSVSWYAPYRDEISPHLHYPDVDVGDALVFDNRVLHGSPTNRTQAPRRAITVMVAHRDAQLVYQHVNGTSWETYAIDTDFFVAHGPMDLRAHPPATPLLEVAAVEPPAAPLDELRTICGVEVAPFEVAQPVALTGDPLGTSAPAGGSAASALAATLHRWVASGRDEPFFEPAQVPTMRELVGRRDALRGAWTATQDRVDELDLLDMGTRFGRWTATPMDGDSSGALRALTDLLDGVFAPDARWIVKAGPQSELVPRRTGNNARAVMIMPLEFTQPSGSCVLQVGTSLEALEPYQPVAFDPTWQHGAWNLGATDIPILWGWTSLALPTAQRLALRVLRSLRSTIEPSPVAT